MQSRGTLLCYLISLLFLILFLYKGKIKNKIKEIIILIFVPFFLYSSINTQIIKNISSDKQENINNRIFEKHSSGRIDIWTFSLKNNDYKKIFGYGSQGDRFFFKKIIIIKINMEIIVLILLFIHFYLAGSHV